MNFTYCEDTYSDLHKEAYGFRPSYGNIFYKEGTTPEEKQKLWDIALKDADETIAAEEAARKESVAKFEKLIAETIAMGAGDAATAVRWLREEEDDDYMKFDDGYFEYTYNLPYGFLKGLLK